MNRMCRGRAFDNTDAIPMHTSDDESEGKLVDGLGSRTCANSCLKRPVTGKQTFALIEPLPASLAGVTGDTGWCDW